MKYQKINNIKFISILLFLIISPVAFSIKEIEVQDLNGSNGFQVSGDVNTSISRKHVNHAGDLNGDGIDDFIIGNFPSGAFVVFGSEAGFDATIDLAELNGINGFEIVAGLNADETGTSISEAGDFNHDGVGDLIIGQLILDSEHNTGVCYIIFGRTNGFDATLNLDSINGTNGIVILGGERTLRMGYHVSKAGDVNGDGIADVIIGAELDSTFIRPLGAAYVIFGSDNPISSPINVGELNGVDGFQIIGEGSFAFLGAQVADAGDFNGDGVDDIIVGAPENENNFTTPGYAYVIFGNTVGFESPIDTAELDDTLGLKIVGEATGDKLGQAVSGAGDVNGDGIDDIIIGAPNASPRGNQSGASYVLFGKVNGLSTPYQLFNLGSDDGFKINGELADDLSGSGVSGNFDYNGDNIDDVSVCSPFHADSQVDSGACYIVFGHLTAFVTPMELADINGFNGVKINGKALDKLNDAPSAGDVNHDGFQDIIIGSSGDQTAVSYVVYGPHDYIFIDSFENLTGLSK